MLAPRETLDAVRCATCNKYLSFFPIYIDQNEMPLCGRCSEYTPEDIKLVRATPYESFAKCLKFPCIYHVEGCLETLYPSEIPDHEKNCSYGIISCALKCKWQGPVNDLLPHFEEIHPKSIINNGKFEIALLNSYERYSLIVHNDELFSFKQKFDSSEKVLECSLLCYKLLDSVTKYNYEISVHDETNKTVTVDFPTKSAENFKLENVTQIDVEDIKKQLGDPSVIIGTIAIFTEEEKKVNKNIPRTRNPEIDSDMMAELECPVCKYYMIPPIYQCVTGHSICTDCKEKKAVCSICQSETTNTRNLILEKMTFRLTYPCKFEKEGCDFAAKIGKIKQHEQFCVHEPSHDCPLDDYEECQWKGAVKKIYSHIFDSHHDNVLEINLVSLFIDDKYFTAQDSDCYILKYSDYLFKLHYLYKENVFYWTMQFIGSPEEAKKYKFEIDVVDNSNNNQRFFLRSTCASLTKKDVCFKVPGQYIVITAEQIRSFITDIFSYRVRIVV